MKTADLTKLRSTVRVALTRRALSLLILVTGAVFAQGGPAFTRVGVFTPFNPGGDLFVGLAVTGEVRGRCAVSSAASPERPDAWRCSARNEILDPCFQNLLGDEKVLACAEEPFSANVMLLTLTAAPPDPSVTDEPDFTGSLPWALELANGQRCTLLTGATAPVAGMRINYGCRDGAQVVGDVDRTLPLWRVFYRTATRSLSLEQSGVTKAWY